MAEKKKKKKRSAEEMHRQVQDSLQAIPYAIDEQKRTGHPVKAFLLRFLTTPVLKVMNRALDAKRYRGPEGEKRKQTERMRRHLEQRQQAIRHVQGQMQQQQRRRGRPM